MKKSNICKYEKNLCDDVKNDLVEGNQILVVGKKRSGKSILSLSFLMWALDSKLFHNVYLIAPNYLSEASGSYDFFKNHKSSANKKVFTKFTNGLMERIRIFLEQNKKKKINKERTLILFDDCTSYGDLLFNDTNFVDIVVSSRHLLCSCIIVCHNLKKCIPPLLRSNISNLIFSKISNRKLLNDIYEEYLSTFIDHNEFYQFYMDKMMNSKFPMICVNSSNFSIDTNINLWFTKEKNKILSNIYITK